MVVRKGGWNMPCTVKIRKEERKEDNVEFPFCSCSCGGGSMQVDRSGVMLREDAGKVKNKEKNYVSRLRIYR